MKTKRPLRRRSNAQLESLECTAKQDIKESLGHFRQLIQRGLPQKEAERELKRLEKLLGQQVAIVEALEIRQLRKNK